MPSDDSQSAWSPDTASRLAVLRGSAERSQTGSAHIELQQLPVRCTLGADAGGVIWMQIECDPETVATDDRSAAVRFEITRVGYRIAIDPTADETVVGHLVEEIVQLIADGHPPGDAGRAALQGWRELLARRAGEPLSENALVGLFGELELLDMIVERGGDLYAWTGWDRDQNDFRVDGLTIEVKSTTSANYRRVQIHGLYQLADPEDGSTLVLVLKRLEKTPTGGASVPELVERLIRRGVSRSELLERLAQMRYFEMHSDQYERHRFVSRDIAIRLIDDIHPRLTPDLLSALNLSAIDKIDYELNLNGDADADFEGDLGSVFDRFWNAP